MVMCSCNPSSQKAGAGELLSSKPVCLKNEREEGMEAKRGEREKYTYNKLTLYNQMVQILR